MKMKRITDPKRLKSIRDKKLRTSIRRALNNLSSEDLEFIKSFCKFSLKLRGYNLK